MGKRQQWESYRLIFGRFLELTTSGCENGILPANLTERRFRSPGLFINRRSGRVGEAGIMFNARHAPSGTPPPYPH
jgi:hypothetical protein